MGQITLLFLSCLEGLGQVRYLHIPLRELLILHPELILQQLVRLLDERYGR